MSTCSIVPEFDARSDLRVYGSPIVDYEVDGTSGSCFLDAVVYAALKQSHSLEGAATALSAVITKRQEEVSDVSIALSRVTEAIATMDNTSGDTNRKSDYDTAKLKAANETFEKYGYAAMELTDDGQVTYAVASKFQNKMQVELDQDSNDLQRDMTSLKGMISKRDNAFSVASKLVSKVCSTTRNTIKAYGV